MKHTVTKIRIEDYDYDLPDDRIAKFPLEERDQSKLLLLKNGNIEERKFAEISGLLPENTLLIFNETKVIRARLLFRKETGARIEIFCLEPVEPSNDYQVAFQQKPPVVWKCLVGNAKRWKDEELIMTAGEGSTKFTLKAEKVEKLSDAFLVRFSWEPEALVFSDIIEEAGKVPLPPYLHREAVEEDKQRYQTVYAKYDGSVAAPTAGLHFTEKQLAELAQKGIETDKVTLHVGAGTFKPVISETIEDHEMHNEKFVVALGMLKHLLNRLDDAAIIPVGTTSMRTLESLYWLALRLLSGQKELFVDQWDPYELEPPENFGMKQALEYLIGFLEKNSLDQLHGETRLMIVPGYGFKLAKGIITNFHQPKSTLLLLVSAMIGDKWKEAYDFAMQNGFRFLSYGDSCLFLP